MTAVQKGQVSFDSSMLLSFVSWSPRLESNQLTLDLQSRGFTNHQLGLGIQLIEELLDLAGSTGFAASPAITYRVVINSHLPEQFD